MKKLYLALGITLVGCGTDNSGPETLPDLEVPAVPKNGIQLVTPIWENIQPGSDNEICAWTDVILDKETDVRSTNGYQTATGHHAVLYYTLEKQPVGQRACTDTDMATFRFLTGNGGEGIANEAPGDLVFRVPAGAQLVVNSHYLNTTDEVARGQTLINVNFADPGKQYTPSGAIALLDTSIDVPVGKSSFTTSCVIDDELKFWYLIPHMHGWGEHIKVELTRANSVDDKQSLFDMDWQEQYQFHPPESRYDVTEPFKLAKGDKVDITCSWNNTENHSLTFGFEMCVVFGQTIDTKNRGSTACNGGRWGSF